MVALALFFYWQTKRKIWGSRPVHMVFIWDKPKYWSRLLLNHMAKWCWWVCFWLSRLFRVWVFWPRKHLSLVILCCKFVGYFLFEMDQVGKLPLSRPVTRYVFAFYWRLHVCTKKREYIDDVGFQNPPLPFQGSNKMNSTVVGFQPLNRNMPLTTEYTWDSCHGYLMYYISAPGSYIGNVCFHSNTYEEKVRGEWY